MTPRRVQVLRAARHELRRGRLDHVGDVVGFAHRHGLDGNAAARLLVDLIPIAAEEGRRGLVPGIAHQAAVIAGAPLVLAEAAYVIARDLGDARLAVELATAAVAHDDAGGYTAFVAEQVLGLAAMLRSEHGVAARHLERSLAALLAAAGRGRTRSSRQARS